MSDKTSFNIHDAHVYFSTQSFNATWQYIEQANGRSLEDDMAMLHSAIVSLWHWTQRGDVTHENLSAGYWQVSRVYNLIRQPQNARTYGLLALKYARELGAFFKAYAYETLARAEMLAENRVIMLVYLEKARQMAETVDDDECRQLLLKDLASIC
jgi:hypothetical protein